MKIPKAPCINMCVSTTERFAAEFASEARDGGYSARIYRRNVKAGGEVCPVFVVVVRERRPARA